jgi:hypothetical protein
MAREQLQDRIKEKIEGVFCFSMCVYNVVRWGTVSHDECVSKNDGGCDESSTKLWMIKHFGRKRLA